MKTEAQKTTQPSTDPTSLATLTKAALLIAHTQANPDSVPVVQGDPILDSPAVKASIEANRQQVIAAEKNLPTCSELEEQKRQINDQVDYWDKVKSDAKANLSGLYTKKNAADQVLAEIPATSKRSQDRSDRNNAAATLEHCGWRIEREERRIDNANIQIKTWEARDKAFPHDTLKKLKAEEKRREKLVGTSMHISSRSARSNSW